MERDSTNTNTKPQAIVFRLSPLISSQYPITALHNTRCFVYITYTFSSKCERKRNFEATFKSSAARITQ
ncbi:hypothetical protein EUGRSUZ_K02001 [Eucalyptus grandis]|uniref:Uncharacterized protein n=2 Tax=Eucalyptus grandis TaxID=71139 RepID=A0ACC3IUS8_EUCGR|nr:hypothetical protein EUGRSUZ_K02001 [Eucalyptus grandis]